MYSDLAIKPRPSPPCASRYTVASRFRCYPFAGMGTLSEGFERFVAAPLQPRRLHAMARTV